MKSRYDRMVYSNWSIVSSDKATPCLSYNRSVMFKILGMFFSSIFAAMMTLVTAKVSRQGAS